MVRCNPRSAVITSRTNSATRFLTPSHEPRTLAVWRRGEKQIPIGSILNEAGEAKLDKVGMERHLSRFFGLHGSSLRRNCHDPTSALMTYVLFPKLHDFADLAPV